jgi:hypothetical protein
VFPLAANEAFFGLNAAHGNANASIIRHVFAQSWFLRTWTIQEIVLARQALLVCGTREILWSDFIFANHTLSESEFTGTDLQGSGMAVNDGVFHASTALYRTLAGFVRFPEVAVPRMQHALRHVREKLCSNPRDKAYGLYGIFGAMGYTSLPAVDYSKTTQQVYIEITRAAITCDSSLRVLHSLVGPKSLLGLPTWVPDWSYKVIVLAIFSEHVNATRGSVPMYHFPDDRRLVLTGVVPDTVRSVSSLRLIHHDDREVVHAIDNYRGNVSVLLAINNVNVFQERIHMAKGLQDYPTGESILQAFARTISQDGWMGDGKSTRLPSNRDDMFQEWLFLMTANEAGDRTAMEIIDKALSDSMAVPEVLHMIKELGVAPEISQMTDEFKIIVVMKLSGLACKFQTPVYSFASLRSFFLTEDDYFGMAPETISSGDQIALFAGLKVPMIIRKSGDSYELLGPAYIHGIMHGERWPLDLDHLTEFPIV